MSSSEQSITQPVTSDASDSPLWDWLEDTPSVVVVRATDLRELARTHRRVVGLDVPHDDSIVLERSELESLVRRAGLLIEPEGLPDPVVLVAEPSPQARAAVPDWAIERRVLALAYHGQIHRVLETEVAQGRLDDVHSAIHLRQLGGTAVREAVGVLDRAERWVGEVTPSVRLIEILATALELRATAPTVLPCWFPWLELARLDAVVAHLGVELGVEALLGSRAATRAAELAELPEAPPEETLPPPDPEALGQASTLAARLSTAVGDAGPAQAVWTSALAPLYERVQAPDSRHARRLWWSLGRACRAAERPGVTYDVWTWIHSRGRTPLRRSLADRIPVQLNRYLRSAHARLRRADLGRLPRRALEMCLSQALRITRERVRRQLRTVLAAAFERTGPTPRVLPERVARDKMIEEIIDRILVRDYFDFADLRDAISRNDLKLPDLDRPAQLVYGDPLLQADRALAGITGVYRPSTFILRLLQRLSSLGFGTKTGRALTRHLVIPLTASFVLLEGLQHLLAPLFGLAGLPHPVLATPISLAVLAALLWTVVVFGSVRHAVSTGLRGVGRGVRWVFVRLPLRILDSWVVRALANSVVVTWARRFVIRPSIVVLLLWLLLWACEVPIPWDPRLLGAALVVTSPLLNSRVGRLLQAHLGDTLRSAWGRLFRQILPELFHMIMEASRQAVAFVERVAFLVDDLLRIRRREAGWRVFTKAVLGRIWAAFMYVVRLYVTLLIEPQVNPIKHFPVVTVAHKILLPILPAVVSAIRQPFVVVLGDVVGNALMGLTVFLLPGFFGFLVWELSANWRLYEASRPQRLPPTRMGTHGHKMPGILRPAFHSGALPKYFERLRREAVRAWEVGERPDLERLDEQRHEVAVDLHDFWDRELLALLRQAPGAPLDLTLDPIPLGRYCCGVRLRTAPGPAMATRDAAFEMWIENRDERLVAHVASAGFADSLEPPAHATLADALTGALARAQVDAVDVTAETEAPFPASEVTWSQWVSRWGRFDAPPESPQLPGGTVVGGAIRPLDQA